MRELQGEAREPRLGLSAAPALVSCPYSPECVEVEFCEIGLSLLLGVCGLLFLDYLQSLDHLEGEAHYAAVLALVLEVDGFVVVVDEDLRHEPAAVVEPLCPFGDVFVRNLFGLLAHPHDLHCLQHCFYPEETQCNPRLNVEHRRGL